MFRPAAELVSMALFDPADLPGAARLHRRLSYSGAPTGTLVKSAGPKGPGVQILTGLHRFLAFAAPLPHFLQMHFGSLTSFL